MVADREKKKLSWLSILSVRLEMGQTTFDIASSLVALGYANLTHFGTVSFDGNSEEKDRNSTVVQQCHFPDPVLARCAMEVTNEDRQKWSRHAMEY